MKFSQMSAPVIFGQAVAIFCSVLLAFAAEQWREDMNERARAEDVLTLVKAELTENLAELERVSATRQEMLDAYIAALDGLVDTGVFPRELPDLSVPEITNVAYQLATDSGVLSRIEPEDVIVVARAYQALSSVQDNQVFLNNRNAQIRFRDGEQYISGFIYFSNRALSNEPEAIVAIEAAIAKL